MNWRPIAAAILIIGFGIWAAAALEHLDRAADEYRRAARAAAPPRLSAGSGQLIAPDIAKARSDLAQHIGDAGAKAGIRLSLAPLPSSDPIDDIVTLRVVAHGQEAGLLRFSANVEQGTPLIRWSRWSILPDGDGGLTLGADAVAPWRAR